MPRPNRSEERRNRLLPKVARAFAELGYRRTTTAELARRCGVRENILYRLWSDKRSMFIASIGYVYDKSEKTWKDLLASPVQGAGAAKLLLEYEASHHGEFGFYRIVFAGLSEGDDPAIRKALHRMYRRFHSFIRVQIEEHRGGKAGAPEPALCAWAFIGLGTIANIGREFGRMGESQRMALLLEVGRFLLDGRSPRLS